MIPLIGCGFKPTALYGFKFPLPLTCNVSANYQNLHELDQVCEKEIRDGAGQCVLRTGNGKYFSEAGCLLRLSPSP